MRSRDGRSGWRGEVRRALVYHRRLLAAGLAAAAVAVGLGVVSPAPPSTTDLLVAAGDLDAGQPITARDVRPVAVPEDVAPDGALRAADQVVGRRLGAPTRRGEILTDVRLVGTALLDGYGAGLVAAPVRLADPGTVDLVRPGDVVDVVAAESAFLDGAEPARAASASARTVARGVRVVAVPGAGPDGAAAAAVTDGGLLVVATTPQVAADLAGAAATARLSITLRPG